MLEAQNVVIREPNVASPRPGLDASGLGVGSPGDALGRVEFSIEENTLGLVDYTGAGTNWDDDTGPVETEKGDALVWAVYSGAVARRSLYIATEDALRVVNNPGDLIAYRAGVPVPAVVSGSGSETGPGDPAYPDNTYRAHKAVTKRTSLGTGQSHISRSAPSNRYVIYESAGPGNKSIRVLLHQGEDFMAGDTIELYSSEFSAEYPNDEYYLNKEVELTSDHISDGYVEILDDTFDEELGAALYTNESREGAEAANVRPPTAKTMCTFNNSLWLGNLAYPARLDLSFRAELGGILNTDAGELGSRIMAGDLTNGSAVVTNVSAPSIAKLKVGMIVERQNPDGHSGTGHLLITSIGATSFTLNETWEDSSDPGATHFVNDSIKIGSEYYRLNYILEDIRVGSSEQDASDLYTATMQELLDSSAAVPLGFDFYLSHLSLGCILTSTAAPEVWATQGALYNPPLPEPTEANGYQMPQDILPDHVAWSKQDEPDHFELSNLEAVGRFGATVYAMAEAGNAIIIATDRGLTRGYGYADSQVSFSEIDKSVSATSYHCIDAIGPRAYIAANDGVYMVTENGATSLTTNRLKTLPGLLSGYVADGRTADVRLVAMPLTGEILVTVPFEDTGDFETAYVYNVDTDAWAYWTFNSVLLSATVKGPEKRLAALDADTVATFLMRDAPYDTPGTTCTITAVADDDVTLTFSGTAVFEEGDVISKGGVNYVVIDVVDSTHVEVHKAGITTGAATVKQGYECRITPVVNTLKTPRLMKLWGQGALQWLRRSGLYRYTLEFRSAIAGATGASQTRVLSPTTPTSSDRRAAPAATSFTVDRAAARGTHLCVSVSITQADADWALSGIAVRGRTTADRPPVRLK